jgi:hypothetical protein
MTTDADERDWFSERPEWKGLLEWEPTPPEMRPRPADKYIELSVKPILTQHSDVDLNPSAILPGGPAKDYGIVLESLCSLLSKDVKLCIPVEMRIALLIKLIGGSGMNPTISAVWPRPGLAPPMYVKRTVKRGDTKSQLSVEYAGTKVETTIDSGRSRLLEEKFKRYEPENIPFIGDDRVTWSIRATDSHPNIEGPHYAGVWITHDFLCQVQIRVKIDVWADVKVFGIWLKRCKLKTIERPPKDTDPWEFSLERLGEYV